MQAFTEHGRKTAGALRKGEEKRLKITVIYGTERKGSTYHMARLFLEQLVSAGDTIRSVVLPKDMDRFCTGCFNCIVKSEASCPHAGQVQPIVQALLEADVLVVETPVYVYNMSGQLKSLMDHLAYLWMPHRPAPAMFHKTAVIFSTAAGAGTHKVNRAVKSNCTYWGIPKVYSYGKNVGAMGWGGVKTEIKAKMEKDLGHLAEKVKRSCKSGKTGIKTKALFTVMRMSQQNNSWNPVDKAYWEKYGWLKENRPWKKDNI